MKVALICNVGTPDSPEPEDVGSYLQEFLMDKNILQMPRPFRDVLVKALIVPRRKFSSAEKYKKIWTEKGSPLMVHSLAVKEKLQKSLGSAWRVHLAMQVGNPSFKNVLEKVRLDRPEAVYFCPLYPQKAQATTGGAIEAFKKNVGKLEFEILAPFYNQEWFLKALLAQIQPRLRQQDHLLLSFHGLPVSQVKALDSNCYRLQACCETSSECYRAQCIRTARFISDRLGGRDVTVGFQSRLGRSEWIGPSTESILDGLLKKGVKNVKVACPSFVADCLETIEEVGLELKSRFLSLGGESFELISCLNDADEFIEGLKTLFVEAANKKASRSGLASFQPENQEITV